MQKIITHLWFDREAREAAAFYTGIFGDSRVAGIVNLDGTPSGEVDIVGIELAGREFQLLSGGPYFRFTPAISFLVTCSSVDEVDRYWAKLHTGGKDLMPLDEYPFSQRYGWTEDRYGLSWQVMYTQEYGASTRIVPTMMFTGA